MTQSLPMDHNDAIRASDADRERALGLLRDHWLAGRLTLEEYEERCDEAARGRFVDDLRRAIRELPYPLPEQAIDAVAPAPGVAPQPAAVPASGSAIASVVLGTLALLGIIGSFGMLFILTLPASTWAWGLGRRARRSGTSEMRVLGTVGEVLGIVATALGCLALSACAMIIGAA